MARGLAGVWLRVVEDQLLLSTPGVLPALPDETALEPRSGRVGVAAFAVGSGHLLWRLEVDRVVVLSPRPLVLT